MKKTKKFSFSVIIENTVKSFEDIAEILYENNCDDSLVSSDSVSIRADFDRYSESLSSAIASAIEDIERANVGSISKILIDKEE